MSRPTVAIVGASSDRSKFGNKSLRAHADCGYDVYAVNPKGGEIEGRVVHKSLSEIPVPIDRVSMYVPPKLGMGMIDEISAKGCRELWLNPGTESDELVAAAKKKGLNVVVGCSIVNLGFSPSDYE